MKSLTAFVMNNDRPNLFIPILVILLIIVFMIPITGMLITPTDPEQLNTPQYDLSDMSLSQVFDIDNDTTFTAFNTLNYELSMTNVFVTGNQVTNFDFGNGTIDGWASGGNYDMSYETGKFKNEIIAVTAGQGYASLSTVIPVISDIYYISFKSRCSRIGMEPDIRFGNAPIYDWTVADILEHSYSRIFTAGDVNPIRVTTNATTDQIGDFVWFDDLFAINLNIFGMSTLTITDMDLLYQFYIDGIYNYEVFELLYNFDLTENQWNYYHNLYVYYSSL